MSGLLLHCLTISQNGKALVASIYLYDGYGSIVVHFTRKKKKLHDKLAKLLFWLSVDFCDNMRIVDERSCIQQILKCDKSHTLNSGCIC